MEIIVALLALRANEIRLVQASLIGSVFSNMLLVLGCCFFFGGIRYTEQYFNTTSAVANMNMLLLSSMALLLPTPFANFSDENSLNLSHVPGGNLLNLSFMSGGCLILMYAQLLVFQLVTHSHLYESPLTLAECPKFTFVSSIIGLLTVTTAVAFLSNILVDSINGFVSEANISKSFVGTIIIPIVGNAIEHITAVSVAMKVLFALSLCLNLDILSVYG